ncbi:MAG: DUF1778 domain-containing protein [Deltaproteobacteria bacterium]|nr:DUF1778 domain-containing protein [Deltaproteobacteria bacterium]
MKRRKPAARRKAESVHIRMTADQKRILAAAADHAGLDLSGWLRSLGLEKAKELASMRQKN